MVEDTDITLMVAGRPDAKELGGDRQEGRHTHLGPDLVTSHWECDQGVTCTWLPGNSESSRGDPKATGSDHSLIWEQGVQRPQGAESTAHARTRTHLHTYVNNTELGENSFTNSPTPEKP